jgi:hypothetical protein
MDLLKKIPIRYTGELHDVRLVNFSVDMKEITGKVPAAIKVRDFGGRALISMVDVKLKNMHPDFTPVFFNFNYRHIAFRLLIEDGMYNSGIHKGIFFFRSFSDNPFIAWGGKLFTDYNLELATIEERNEQVTISQGGQYVKYRIGNDPGGSTNTQTGELQETVGALDRAYSLLNGTIRVTRIQRERWPIQPVICDGFENTFFSTAKLEAAFRVFETIYYEWLPPEALVV